MKYVDCVCPCDMCDGKDVCTMYNKRHCVSLNEWEENGTEDDE